MGNDRPAFCRTTLRKLPRNLALTYLVRSRSSRALPFVVAPVSPAYNYLLSPALHDALEHIFDVSIEGIESTLCDERTKPRPNAEPPSRPTRSFRNEMQFFHTTRKQRLVAGPVTAYGTEGAAKLPPHADTHYDYPADYLSGENLTMIPATPPPEYQPYDEGSYLSPDLANRPYQSQRSQKPSALMSRSAVDPRSPQYARVRSTGNDLNTGSGRGGRLGARSYVDGERLGRDDAAIDAGGLVALAEALDLGGDAESVAVESRAIVPVAERRRPGQGTLSFKRAWMYQNSRLPPGMVPFNVFLPTWTLLCRAAKACLDVYERPKQGPACNYTAADPKQHTKATIIKYEAVDDRKLLVIAIRGSKMNVVDWTINVHTAPALPVGFMDDEGNACHAGFLEVARAMIGPIAAQLRSLVDHDQSYIGSSLVFTGHSAGGAVASLLYMHMMANRIDSDLTALAGLFRRLHCITFGTPPLTLLPLQLPIVGRSKNLFLSFVNEGDVVVRLTDLSYVKSLLRLAAAPVPATANRPGLRERISCQRLRTDGPAQSQVQPPRWLVPEASLSLAGRMVLLRERPNTAGRDIEAVQVTDQELREVVFGDHAMHAMFLYKQRIDELAFSAMSGRSAGED